MKRPVHKRPARRIALINHKGGVGKTTLTINLAVALCELGKRVLIVDADPQCNVSSHFLADEEVDQLLDSSDTMQGRTVWSAIRPFVESEGDIQAVKPFELYAEGLSLLPGDIRLANFEEELGEMWGQCFRRKLRGLRGTAALSRLITDIERIVRPDFVFYDSGPNIGPLNRIVALDCSHIVTPVACDLFSLRALKTLGHSLVNWIADWSTVRQLAPETEYLLPGHPRFIGYLPQSFRVYGGEIASNSGTFVPKLERQVRTEIVARLKSVSPTVSEWPLRLGSVKHFGELVPKAQIEGCALWDVSGQSRPAKAEAKRVFTVIARELIRRTERQ